MRLTELEMREESEHQKALPSGRLDRAGPRGRPRDAEESLGASEAAGVAYSATVAGAEGLLADAEIAGLTSSGAAGAEGTRSGAEADWAGSPGVADVKRASAALGSIKRPWRSAMVFSLALTSARRVRIRPWTGGRV